MSSILIANIGSYPRNGEEKDHQRHRRGLTNFQNKEISAHAFRDVEQSVIQEVLADQIGFGLDEVTDGLISWQDPISHIAQKIGGIKITGLRRYFDANFYYRIPVITGKPKKKDSFIKPDFIYAQQNSPKPIRAVLMGPLTLAFHTQSELRTYEKLESRVKLFTDYIAEEVKQLIQAGCTSIQIDEPSILKYPSEIKLLQKSLQALVPHKKNAQLTLAVYYNSVAPVFKGLSELPVDGLQLDFTYDDKALWQLLLKAPTHLTMGLGLLNARQIALENIDTLLNSIRHWLDQRKPERCFITPSSGLEFLPKEAAQNKLRLLSKIRSELVLAHV